MARPRLPDEVKKARGTFRPSRASNTSSEPRNWPVRNPECDDIELQDEAVEHLQRLYDAVTAEWIVDGDINPLIGELAKVESVCVANGVIKESKMGKLLVMMADGMLHA